MNSAGETIISAFSYKETLKCTIKMTCSDGKILPILFIFCLNFELCYSACARAEYEIDGECCPMCGAGNRVYRDCTESTSTKCTPCMGATFIDVPNGRTACFNCMICDPGVGLRVKTACTRTSDTVCEPLPGFYCTEQHRGSCIHAKKHTKCHPGEFIQHMGTADRDAVCEKCGDGTFSDGSLQTCQPHSKCEDRGLREVKPGTDESDTECGKKISVAPIICTVILLIIFLALAAEAVRRLCMMPPSTGKQHTIRQIL
ncbi:tumor necrosis factor receptor superfamily member 14-like [Astyanax mexicanus]|uniref:tumor necrosis factor receptor superfamily member 14-like n=1 Tax=Astyanax mexicanus TaxID=7994 RepID=UPI0020CB4696|nr:tumor necrosis factor receptor superfamily member 14-like [Astyanax mexicanus]